MPRAVPRLEEAQHSPGALLGTGAVAGGRRHWDGGGGRGRLADEHSPRSWLPQNRFEKAKGRVPGVRGVRGVKPKLLLPPPRAPVQVQQPMHVGA
jgi:hypothetical protein